jgi:hypothetical protein
MLQPTLDSDLERSDSMTWRLAELHGQLVVCEQDGQAIPNWQDGPPLVVAIERAWQDGWQLRGIDAPGRLYIFRRDIASLRRRRGPLAW